LNTLLAQGRAIVRGQRPATAAKRSERREIGPREREPQDGVGLVFRRSDLTSRAATPRRRTFVPCNPRNPWIRGWSRWFADDLL